MCGSTCYMYIMFMLCIILSASPDYLPYYNIHFVRTGRACRTAGYEDIQTFINVWGFQTHFMCCIIAQL